MRASLSQKDLESIVKQRGRAAIVEKSRIILNQAIQIAIQNTIDFIDKHPVTRDIEDGTNTAGLIDGDGDIRQFLGFEVGTNPTEDIKNLIRENTYVRLRSQYGIEDIQFNIVFPQFSQVEEKGKNIPWASGLSWVSIIDEISNVTAPNIVFFLYFDQPIERSRQEHGLQVGNTVNRSQLSKASYYNDIIKEFKRNLQEFNFKG